MKNTNFGKFIDLKCSTNFKDNLKNIHLFYNKVDKKSLRI